MLNLAEHVHVQSMVENMEDAVEFQQKYQGMSKYDDQRRQAEQKEDLGRVVQVQRTDDCLKKDCLKDGHNVVQITGVWVVEDLDVENSHSCSETLVVNVR